MGHHALLCVSCCSPPPTSVGKTHFPNFLKAVSHHRLASAAASQHLPPHNALDPLLPPGSHVVCQRLSVGFGRQHILARPMGPSMSTTSTSVIGMLKGDPVTYEELTPEHKQKFDEIKALFEADLNGSFERTRHHDIR
jgi:hypothetical protein